MRSSLPLVCFAALTVACGRAEDRPIAPAQSPPPIATVDRSGERLPPSVAALDRDPNKERNLRDPFVSYTWDCYDCNRDWPIGVPFSKTPVDELRVLGTVVDGAQRSALIGDPSGRTMVVSLGSQIGRNASDDEAGTTWKIERIQNGDVTLVSAPPAGSSEPPSRRSLSSHRG